MGVDDAKVRSRLRMADLLKNVFVVTTERTSGKIVQTTTTTHFRVGVEPCDSSLTVAGPIYSLCGKSNFAGDVVVSGSLVVSGSITTGGGGLNASNSAYIGYVTSSLTWTSPTWTPVHTAFGGQQVDVLERDIHRSGSDYALPSGGLYHIEANFNVLGVVAQVGFRLRADGTTLIQHFDTIHTYGQRDIALNGYFHVTSSVTASLQYAVKSGSTFPITMETFDGERLWQGNISIVRISD